MLAVATSNSEIDNQNISPISSETISQKNVVKKDQIWCEEKLGNIFDKIDYHLSKIQQKIVQVKYELILKKLELYEKINWITKAGSDIIKEDVKYLII